MSFIEEKAKQIPVYGEYDVAVVGGGIAGIAAALAASRHGAKTVLIEKQFALGGLATLGLVTIYLPICDGCGRQVSFGIAEELLKLSMKYGCEGRYPKAWVEGGTVEEKKNGGRYMVDYNGPTYMILTEQLLLEEGVEILYGTSVCAANVSDGKVDALFIENKSGRSAIKAKSVVDASGDADVFAIAGAKTENFGQGNILAAWYFATEDGKYTIHPIGCCDVPDKEKDKRPATELLSNRRFAGLDGKELSEMVQMSHERVLSDFMKRGDTMDRERAISTIATIPQVRMTRRPAGKYTLDDSEDHKYFEDSIGLISDWRRPGPIFEVPFRCLYGDLKNVVAAGRCISNTDSMWDITRVIPCCSVTGQAAGTAAAMSDDFENLDVKKLQDALEKDGVVLHI